MVHGTVARLQRPTWTSESLIGSSVAATTAGLAVVVDGEEDTGTAVWTMFTAHQFAVLNFVLGPLSFGVWTVSHHSSPPSLDSSAEDEDELRSDS